jgi:hypothetical protein
MPMQFRMNEWMNGWMDESINQSINQPIRLEVQHDERLVGWLVSCSVGFFVARLVSWLDVQLEWCGVGKEGVDVDMVDTALSGDGDFDGLSLLA